MCVVTNVVRMVLIVGLAWPHWEVGRKPVVPAQLHTCVYVFTIHSPEKS